MMQDEPAAPQHCKYEGMNLQGRMALAQVPQLEDHLTASVDATVFNPLRTAHHLQPQTSGGKLCLSLFSSSSLSDSASAALGFGLHDAATSGMAADVTSPGLAPDAASCGWGVEGKLISFASPASVETGTQSGHADNEKGRTEQCSSSLAGTTHVIRLWRPPLHARDTAQPHQATATTSLASILVTKPQPGTLVRLCAAASMSAAADNIANLASLPSSNLSSVLGVDTEASSSLASLVTDSSSNDSILHASSNSSVASSSRSSGIN
jgi:hypothetical protein